MKLELGMYVRTDEGIITKIIDNRDNVIIKTDDYTTHLRSRVVKASYNIIDLIEVGDYANGYIAKEVWENGVLIDNFAMGKIIYSNEIKSIVTKEMFESMSYKVKNER